jgi:large conductance mechanosensitive channel
MSGFKNFIMRGNLVELAVAVVIGTQFSNLVKQFVTSFINPLLALFGGKPNFSNLVFTVGKKGKNQGIFTYGTFLTEVLTFLISALVVYFVLVMPVSRLLKLLERNKRGGDQGLPRVHDEHPGCGQALPRMHGADRAGHRTAPAHYLTRDGSATALAARRAGLRPHWPARQDARPGRRLAVRIPR